MIERSQRVVFSAVTGEVEPKSAVHGTKTPELGVGLAVCTHLRAPHQASCANGPGQALGRALARGLAERGLHNVPVVALKCFGLCEQGPNVRITPGGEFFHHVSLRDVNVIVDAVERHLKTMRDQTS
ncbi:MAG: (2Fe-2S) ferredoxin domain-containing protein [Gammaproteobacteria bacterium]|nr:(2Fe-2S) ferredoxin domain-containing protein [Gammaproteobacteria bacterium]